MRVCQFRHTRLCGFQIVRNHIGIALRMCWILRLFENLNLARLPIPPHPLVGNGDCFPPFGFNPSKEFEAGPLVRLRVAYRLLKKQETA
jgi:hypothetical protein